LNNEFSKKKFSIPIQAQRFAADRKTFQSFLVTWTLVTNGLKLPMRRVWHARGPARVVPSPVALATLFPTFSEACCTLQSIGNWPLPLARCPFHRALPLVVSSCMLPVAPCPLLFPTRPKAFFT
jgi:hypothetical protein